MKIAIVGAGAMGSVYAGLLAEAGHEIWMVDAWQAHIEAIKQHGLQLSGASGDRVIGGLNATMDISHAGRCDLYVIATKADGVGVAARSIAPLMAEGSTILTIQNGMGAAERIAEHICTEHVLLGVADGFGASVKAPGWVHHAAMNLIRVGELSGGLSDRLGSLVAVWREAGFNAKAFADIQQLIWEKFLCNVTFSGSCTAFDCTLGELMADEQRWDVALACTREAYAEGVARQINFSFDDPIAYVTAFGQSMPDARPSMLLDHHAGRRSELSAINGAVPVMAKARGASAPYNQTLTAVLSAREEKFNKAGS